MVRISTAVLLTRGSGPQLEVYLVERNPRLAFLGGFWAFPGGVLDPALDGELDPDEGLSLRACAVRELFEETGVLLPPWSEGVAAAGREALRRGLVGSGEAEATARRDWGELARRARAVPAPLRRVCRLTTPEFAARRYRTLFLHGELPPGEEPHVLPGELVAGRFARPAEALHEWRTGHMAIAPPVLYLLEFLATESIEALPHRADRAAREIEDGRLHPARFSPGVWTAPLRTPTVPPATTTNCYLVGEGEVYVVDPATYDEAERARLLALLDELSAAGRTLRGVLVTHHHVDHVGSVAAVAARYRLPVLAHRETLARLPSPPGDARALRDGDELELGAAPDGSDGWKLTALHTPGHDRGHLVFLESRYRALLAGDLASTLSTIVIDPPEGHLSTYLDSLRRVQALGVGMLHPAHGPSHPDGGAVLREFLAHRADREAQLVRALVRGPETEERLLRAVYDDLDPRALPLASRSLLAGLLKLEEQGLVERDGERWLAPPMAGRNAPVD